MSISTADWKEAEGFLQSLGYRGHVLSEPEFQKDALRYLSLLLQKNEEVNLTGARDLETAFWKHLVDSLVLLSLEPLGNVADWGSGGGLPGIPLALARKHGGDTSSVCFVDSVGKKIRAVEAFCAALGLPEGRGHIGRGEDLIAKGVLKQVSTVTMRAVAPADKAIDWLHPSIASWVFFLGPNQVEDWKRMSPRLAKKRLSITEDRSFPLPRGIGQRCLLRISKSST